MIETVLPMVSAMLGMAACVYRILMMTDESEDEE